MEQEKGPGGKASRQAPGGLALESITRTASEHKRDQTPKGRRDTAPYFKGEGIMSNEHTKGDWHFLRQGKEIIGEGGHEVVTFIGDVPVSICEIPVEQHCSTSNPGGEDPKYHVGLEESIANGKLLAAGPAMKHTLELLLELSPRNSYEQYREAVNEIVDHALDKLR